MSYDKLNVFLNVAVIVLLLGVDVLAIFLLVRVYRATREVAAFALVIEDDSRKMRHAIRNLAHALRLEGAVEELFAEPNDGEVKEEVKAWLLKGSR